MFGTYPVFVCPALSNQNEVFKLSRVAHSFALYVNVSDGPISMKYSNKSVVIKASDCEQCAETERVELDKEPALGEDFRDFQWFRNSIS